MAEVPTVDTHGLEVIRRSGFIPDDANPTRFALRTSATGTFSLTGLNNALRVTTMNVGDTETALPATALSNRNSIIIHNTDTTNTLYIGPTGVTADQALGTTAGLEVGPQSYFNIDITEDIVLYGIAETGNTLLVKVTEVA